MLKYSYLLIMLLLCNPVFAVSGSEETKSDTLKFKERLGIHTNALGWLLLTPNVGIEYDVVRNDHKKVSLLFSGRYNWASNQDLNSRYVYNIAGLRAETRWYYRIRERRAWENDLVESTEGFFNRLFESKRLLFSNPNPHSYRAYYVGPYVSYDNLTLKLGSEGRQGNIISAGVSFGYTFPLYMYNNGTALDLEFGASVGAAYMAYDKFGYNDEDKCYIAKGEQKGELLPYPVISDLRVSLVYRMEPIRNQIKYVNEESLAHDSTMYSLRLRYIDNYDNIYGPDTLAAEYNGQFKVDEAFKGDSAAYARAYSKAVKNYKDSIAEHHVELIAKLNSEIKTKNARVRYINEQIMAISGADSTKLLEELRPAYNYVQMPQKLLTRGSKVVFPNDSIGSVRELDVKLIDELIEKHSAIENDGMITSVESRLLEDYNSLREKLLNDKDSVNGISYFELLVNAIPNINEYCIESHNNAYVIGEAKEERDSIVTARAIKFEHFEKAFAMPFLENNDTIYLKPVETTESGIKSLNEEIEARNLVKIAEVQKEFGVVLKTTKKDKVEKSDKEVKAALKKAKAEAKAAEKAAKAEAKAAKKAAKAEAKAKEKQAKEEAKAAKKGAETEIVLTPVATEENSEEPATEKNEENTENVETENK